MLHAASEPTGEGSVVITLRSDFWSETQRHEQLNQAIGSDYMANVPAMTVAELRSAIEEPAKQAGYSLDEATIELLVKDTEGREGALPLMQFSLARIWDGLSEGKTPATAYREMGGVGGALAGKAQETYDRLRDSDQSIARRIFVGLVQLGEGTRDTRRRVRVDGLVVKGEAPERVKKVIDQFSSLGARLITLSSEDGHEIAEVTHEALFEHWQLFSDWLDVSRDDIRFHRRLENAAQYWDEQGRVEGLLWRSPDLDLLNLYQSCASQDMTEIETTFWRASEKAGQRRKRTRRLVTGGLVLGFLLALLSTGVASWNVLKANRKTQEANLNNVRALAQSAATLNASGEALDAIIMALRAAKQFSNDQLTDSVTLNQIKEELYASLLQDIPEVTRFEGHSDAVWEVRFSPDGNTIATASRDGTVKLWKTDGALITTLENHNDSIVEVLFSLDGSTIATASSDGTAKLWKIDGTEIATFRGHTDSVNEIHFSSDGNVIATASNDGTAKLWKIDGIEIANLTSRSWQKVTNARFSPDGNIIVVHGNDGTRGFDGVSSSTKLWKVDGTEIANLRHSSATVTSSIDFSPDGNIIATDSAYRTATLWNRDGTEIAVLDGHSSGVEAVRFSPDGETLVTASSDGTAKLWQVDGTLLANLEGHSDTVSEDRISPEGTPVAADSRNRTATR